VTAAAGLLRERRPSGRVPRLSRNLRRLVRSGGGPEVVLQRGILQNALRDPFAPARDGIRAGKRNEVAPVPSILRELVEKPDRTRESAYMTVSIPFQPLIEELQQSVRAHHLPLGLTRSTRAYVRRIRFAHTHHPGDKATGILGNRTPGHPPPPRQKMRSGTPPIRRSNNESSGTPDASPRPHERDGKNAA